VTYTVFSFLGIGDKGDMTGLALLVSVRYLFILYIIYLVSLFLICTQGGTFLYVATVLQPVKHHSPVPGEMRASTRVFIIILGMFIPLVFRLFHHTH
jgi:solute carrier family 39 (zinc transporter), member 9